MIQAGPRILKATAKVAQTLALLLESEAKASAQAACLARHAMGEGVPVWGGQLRRRRGRWGPQVSHKVRNADVAFMADGGHHGARAGDDGPGDPLVIESP